MKTLIPIALITVICVITAPAFADLTAEEYTPSDIEVTVNTALDSMRQTDQPIQAQINYLRQILQEYPDNTVIHRRYQDLMRGDSIDDLRREYQQLAENDPTNPVYDYLNARIARSPEDRWRWAAKAVRNDPDFFWGHLIMGYHFLNLDAPELQQAETSLLRAVEIDNSQAIAYVNLAQLYDMQSEPDKVMQMYRLASECEPDNFGYVSRLANRLAATDLDGAIEEVDNFLKHQPDNPSALNRLTILYLQKNQFDRAIEASRKLVALDKNDAYAWYDLAAVFAQASLPDSAFHALNKSIILGWNDLRHMAEDPDLTSLHTDPRWDSEKQKITQELQRTAPDRRQQALQDKLNIPAPVFEFPDMDGETVNLADLRGKVVVLDFWALWCGWCLKAMPLVEEFWRKYQDQDVVVLSMNVRENRRKDVPPFIQDNGYTFRVVFGDDKVYNDYGIRGIPAMFVIDQSGIIRYKHIGYNPRLSETLGWQVENLLEN
jgi:tetratricopeptide (TPR) repeat protein